MPALNEIVALCKQLKSEWSTPKPNLSKCEHLLSELKVSVRLFLFLLVKLFIYSYRLDLRL